MNRVFICGYYNFPRGGAAANYVQYFGSALKSIGKEVVCITNVNSDFGEPDMLDEYQGLRIRPIKLRKGRLSHYIDFNYRMGEIISRELSACKPDIDDIVIAYSRDPKVLKKILSICKKTKTKTGVCLVEWFERKDLSTNKDFLQFEESFELNKQFDFLFPISTYIEEYYKQSGSKTLCIPCLTDTAEYPRIEKDTSGRRVFIYPANGKIKDAFSSMIRAICLLPETDIGNAEFHITGVKRDKVDSILCEMNRRELLDKNIFIHGWMKYEDLIDLYQNAHYILLAREKTRMTKANFPSKIPEALTYGIIPVCSRVGDYTKYYLFDETNAIIFDGCHPETIADSIIRAIRMSDSAIGDMSEACRHSAETSFDYRCWSEKLRLFLNEVEI